MDFYEKGSNRPRAVNKSEFSILAVSSRTGKVFLGFFFFLAALSISYNPSFISHFRHYLKVFLAQTSSPFLQSPHHNVGISINSYLMYPTTYEYRKLQFFLCPYPTPLTPLCAQKLQARVPSAAPNTLLSAKWPTPVQNQCLMYDDRANCRTPASSVGFRHKRAGSDLLLTQYDGSSKYGTGLG